MRGILGLLPTSLGNGGVMLCYILGFFFDWKHLSLLGAVIPLPFLILMCMIPETPRYLVSKNRERDAKAALQWLRGGPAVDVNREMHDMEMANLLIKKGPNRFKASELFRSAYVKPLAVSVGLMFFQQFSGINAVMFYSVNIFRCLEVVRTEPVLVEMSSCRLAGSSIDSNLATILLGVVNIGATVLSNALIDRLGRKMLLYISSSGGRLSHPVTGQQNVVSRDGGEPAVLRRVLLCQGRGEDRPARLDPPGGPHGLRRKPNSCN